MIQNKKVEFSRRNLLKTLGIGAAGIAVGSR